VAAVVGKPLPPRRFRDMGREQALKELFNEVKAVADRAEQLRRKA
jgi:hypothetical protein